MKVNRSLTEEQKLSVRYNMVKRLMEMLYAADVLPYLKIQSGDRIISGYCLKYAWEQPSYLLVEEDKEKGGQVLKVFVGAVDAVEIVKERCVFKEPGTMEKFFKMVRPELSEVMQK